MRRGERRGLPGGDRLGDFDQMQVHRIRCCMAGSDQSRRSTV